MEKGRKTKVIAILALVVAVAGISLGFAAFSNILTISSSATVTPNEEDFKIKIYGVINKTPENLFDLPSYTSQTTAIAELSSNYATATEAVINNDTLTISNMQANFTTPASADYTYVVKNEGNYDAYINFSDYADLYIGGLTKKCTPGEGTTEELVNKACNSIYFLLAFGKPTSDGKGLDMIVLGENYPTESYKIEPGEILLIGAIIRYEDGVLADGPFSVAFDDIQLKFSTAP